MAANSKNASASKKNPSGKKPSQKSDNSPKKPAKKPAVDPQKRAELQKYIRRKRLQKALILLGIGFFCVLFFMINGEKFWEVLHQCYWGLFGFMGFCIPIFCVYYAYQLATTKRIRYFTERFTLLVVTVLLFAAVFFSFGSAGMDLEDYGTELMECFRKGGQHIGTGFIGGLLGIPVAKIFGATGGGIILLLLFLLSFYQTVKVLFAQTIEKFREPVSEKIMATVELRKRIREEEQKIKEEQIQKMQEEFIKKQAEKRAAAEQKNEPPKEQKETQTPKPQTEPFVSLHKNPFYRPEKNQETSPAASRTAKKGVVKKLVSKLAAPPEIFEDPHADPVFVPDAASQDIPKNQEPETVPQGVLKKQEPETVPQGVLKKQKPETVPKDVLKKQESESPKMINMDFIGSDVAEFPENISIDYSQFHQKQEDSSPKYDEQYINGEFFSPVFKKPKKHKRTEKPAPPKQEQEKMPETIEISVSDVKKQLKKPDISEPVKADENAYLKPPFTLLEPPVRENAENVSQELNTSAVKLVDTLKSFGVQTSIINISRGPSVTRYELQPASGVKISKITNLSDDIAMNLAATGVRIEAPIPGKSAVGIEVPNKNVSVVKMRSLVESTEFQNAKSKLTVALGMDITGKITLADLGKMPHLLIAGSTGSGKSVCINSMIISLLYKSSPEEVKLMLIDPKVVELGVYNGIPHLLVPVVTDPRKAAGALNWAVNEMLERYKTFAEYNVRDMHSYNRLVDRQNAQAVENDSPEETTERTFEEDEMLAQAKADINNAKEPPKEIHKLEKMCQIVIVIDELADLMMAAPNDVEESICRLAQMARAAGMHLVIATQRPSVDVITGLIKANVPSRIAFAVKSQIDSRTILDSGGAEKLLGRGDMLFSPIGITKPIRVQGGLVEDTEIENVVNFIKNNKIVEYDKDVMDEIEKNAAADKSKDNDNTDSDADPMIEQAIECVVEVGQASTSLLQRRLRVGYARAGRLVDEMERMGIVGPHQGAKPRDVLMTRQQWLERNLQKSD